MKKYLAAAATATVLIATPLPVNAHIIEAKCADESPNMAFQNSWEDCKHVQQVIHDLWPDPSQHQAIQCFANESGLDKWAHFKEGSQYKGIAQMGSSERAATEWKWRVKRQIQAALRLFQARRFSPWYAPAC